MLFISPRFILRNIVIVEVELSAEVKKQYKERKKIYPQAILTIKTTKDLALSTLVAEKQTFKGTIQIKSLEISALLLSLNHAS